ncbi:MAG TPA: flavodoxin family protein, partial [Bacillota bacterium]|nr:flavodoxin family protein [Bacillota bacterium]
LEAAASQGAETELIHLYDYEYHGCTSCFACKLKGAPSYGRCAVNDQLKPILQKATEAGALLLGSPIYFSDTTGAMRSFLERLMFQYLCYDTKYTNLFPGRIAIGLIYTMNINEDFLKQIGYEQRFKHMEKTLERFFGSAESLFVTDTYQFDDYSKYETSAFDAVAKARHREEVFPLDCQKAFEMGVRLVSLS